MGGVSDPRNMPLPYICYFAERDCSVLKGVDINRGEPQNWGVLGLCSIGMGAWLTPSNPLLKLGVVNHLSTIVLKDNCGRHVPKSFTSEQIY